MFLMDLIQNGTQKAMIDNDSDTVFSDTEFLDKYFKKFN